MVDVAGERAGGDGAGEDRPVEEHRAGGGPARPPTTRLRREPPRFRRAEVVRVEALSPRMVRVTLAGPELDGLVVDQPASSVRLLLPSPGSPDLVVPRWNGNEFLLPDGRRPVLRTFTPALVDAGATELDLEIVLHGAGAASGWAEAVEPGAPAAVSGTGRGYVVEAPGPTGFLLAGDESAVPAVGQLLRAIPGETPVEVRLEVARPDARLALPDHPRATVEWCDLAPGAPPGDALVAAVRRAEVPPTGRVWAAGEAAAVQRIRRHLFEDRGLPRTSASVRGYWKHGRSGGDDA